jgi:uncharacterized protein YrzB (UPF0473 family)
MIKTKLGGGLMISDFGNDYVTISDDDGNEFELEHLDTIELDGNYYMAFLPADMDEDDDNFGLIILKKAERGGEELLVTIDDDSELSVAFEHFIERLSDEGEQSAEDIDA